VTILSSLTTLSAGDAAYTRKMAEVGQRGNAIVLAASNI